jgi:hypothetical protein
VARIPSSTPFWSRHDSFDLRRDTRTCIRRHGVHNRLPLSRDHRRRREPSTETKPAPRPLPVFQDIKTPAPLVPVDPTPAEVRRTGSGPAVAPPKSSDREPQPSAGRPIDFAHPYFDEPGDGALWACGDSYKASFDAQGFTYVPFFGSRAPRNFPVGVRLESVHVGGQLLAFLGAGARTRSDDRVVIERGSLTELYDLDPRGVKQEFVFDSLPAGGDVRVRLAIDTELQPRTSDEGVEFANDLGFVRYGKATVLDAAGRSQLMDTSWVDGAIELIVPAAFLAEARFPVTIDPVFVTFTVDATVEDDNSPDVAFENTTFLFAICWERIFSATDHDVWIEEYDILGGAIAGTRNTIDFTSVNWQHPRIASNVLSSQFLVVAQAGAASGGARVIRGRTMESESPFALGSQFDISGGESGDKLDPDVGGDPVLTGPTYYCVVWTRVLNPTDADVHARLVLSNSTLLGGGTFPIDNTGGTWDINATVSKSDGPVPFSAQDWNIAWERELPGAGGLGDIHGAQVHWDGMITTPSFPIAATSDNDGRPSASTGLDLAGVRHYAVAFTRDFGDHDIELAILQGSTLEQLINVSSEEDVFTGLLFQDQLQPSVDASDEFFHVTYAEQYSTSTTDYDIWASALSFNGTSTVLAEVHENLAFSSSLELNPQVSTRRSGGAPGSDTLAATWDDFAGPGINNGDIEAATMTVPTGGPVQVLCAGDGSSIACPCAAGGFGNGCPNSLFAGGANLATTGNANVSSDTLVLRGTSMPNATCVYFQGMSFVSPFVIDDGIMCTGGTIIRLGSKLNAGDQSQYPSGGDPSVSVRGAIPAAGGETRMYQAFYRNAAAFCTPSTSNRTNGLRITWLP